MRNHSKALIQSVTVGIFFLGMAVTLPSCPGQQAMQEQIDTLNQNASKQSKAVNDLSTQVRAMSDEINTMKNLLAQVSNTVLEQKTTLEQIQAKQASAKMTPAPAPRRGTTPPRRR